MTNTDGALTQSQLHTIDCALKRVEKRLVFDHAKREEAALVALNLWACGFTGEAQLAGQLFEALTSPLSRR
jgi:hypothetical protein